MSLRGLIVGGGSIGARHLANLNELGFFTLALVEPVEHKRNDLATKWSIQGFGTIKEGLDFEPDFVVVASPSHHHIKQALEAAVHDCHLFIEKPLAHTNEGLDELVHETESRNLVSLVGCNMRFHPGPSRVKKLILDGHLGKPLFARIHTGSYLPEWRPSQDYRLSYSAQSATGGGCLLDCIHEVDLTRWYLGDVKEVFCLADHVSDLEIDVEDIAILTCRHENGSLSEIHLDFVQRSYERGCQIVCEAGSIFWDYTQGRVRLYDATSEAWSSFEQPSDWTANQMYVDEMRHFIDCVAERKQATLPVSDAARVMSIVFAAKDSARSGRFIRVDGV